MTVTAPVTALRSEPHPEAEEVSQAIGGDEGWAVAAAGGRNGWKKLCLRHDRYEGWVPARCVRPGSWRRPARADFRVRRLFAHLHSRRAQTARPLATIPLGTPVRRLRPTETGSWWRVRLADGSSGFVRSANLSRGLDAWSWRTPRQLGASVAVQALALLGIPYRWGGTTPLGLDCSGLVQLVFRLHGVPLPRDARLQVRDPRGLDWPRSRLAAGDLLFFDSHRHVGVAVSHGRFVHATTTGWPGVQLGRVDDPAWVRRRDVIRRIRPPRTRSAGGLVQDGERSSA